MALEKGNGVPALILIVEDQPLHAKLFRDIVRVAGFHAVTVATGDEALRVVACAAPDLVLLDILLPDIDGRDLIGRIRADPGRAALPIVAISARVDREMSDGCLAAGADAFLAKPVPVEVLVEAVQERLGR